MFPHTIPIYLTRFMEGNWTFYGSLPGRGFPRLVTTILLLDVIMYTISPSISMCCDFLWHMRWLCYDKRKDERTDGRVVKILPNDIRTLRPLLVYFRNENVGVCLEFGMFSIYFSIWMSVILLWPCSVDGYFMRCSLSILFRFMFPHTPTIQPTTTTPSNLQPTTPTTNREPRSS